MCMPANLDEFMCTAFMQVSLRPERVRFPGIRVTGSYVSARNRTQVLWKTANVLYH